MLSLCNIPLEELLLVQRLAAQPRPPLRNRTGSQKTQELVHFAGPGALGHFRISITILTGNLKPQFNVFSLSLVDLLTTSYS